jgi:hypothetical protein
MIVFSMSHDKESFLNNDCSEYEWQETSQPTGIHPLPSLATYHFQVLQELLKAFQENSIKGFLGNLMK